MGGGGGRNTPHILCVFAFAFWGPGPALGGREKYRFYVTRVPGPSVCIYNVPNGRTLAPDTGCVQNKQRFATSSWWWPPASLQSAKSAAGAPWAVRGSHLSRLVSLPPLCICCTARLPHINTVDLSNVWQHCGLINRRFHVCLLSSAEARRHPSGEYMLHAWLVDLLVAEPRKVAQVTAKVDRVPAAFRSST